MLVIGMKRKGRMAVGYALCCCLAAACDPPEVCDGQSTNILADTPKAVPCSSDKLKFSPDSGVLESSALAHRTGLGGSADGSGMLPVGAAGSTGMALDGGARAPETGDGVDTLDMALVAEDYSGQPRDTVGVDVVVCSSDSPGLATLSPAENMEECEALTA
jgi:hypothetical protein